MSPSAAQFAGLTCAVCGYDLRGLPENVCPECGVAFDPTRTLNPNRQPSPQAGLVAAVFSLFVSPTLIGFYLMQALDSIVVPPMGTCGTFRVHQEETLWFSGVFLAVPFTLWCISSWAKCGERIARNAFLAALTVWLTCSFMIVNQYAF